MAMPEYTIMHMKKRDFDAKLYKSVTSEATTHIDAAKDEDVLMLQICFNSPEMSITKALPATLENLSKITEIR